MNNIDHHNGREPNHRLRTLVVDDSLLMAERLCYYLKADGRFEVVSSASNGRLAVDLVAQLQPDLVLMDVRMPEMNGLEATRQIKSRPDAPAILIVTLDDTPSCRAEAKTVGADGFVSKAALSTELPRSLAALHKAATLRQEPLASVVAAACSPRDPPLR